MKFSKSRPERTLWLIQDQSTTNILTLFQVADSCPLDRQMQKSKVLEIELSTEQSTNFAQIQYLCRKAIGSLLYLKTGTLPELGFCGC